MKHLLILLCTVFVFNFGYSQNQKSITTQRVERSTNVFTGKILSKRCYETEKMIYTAYTVEAQTSFKGNVPTHFEIITEGGVVGDKFVIASHTPKFTANEEAIFFCNPNTYYPTDNKFSTTSMVLSATPVSKTNEIGYQYAYRDVLEAVGVPINQFKIKKQSKTTNNNSTTKSNTEIEYSFGNVVLSGSNNQFLEFDVQAKANVSGLDFGKAELYLEYTPQTFGTNVVGNGNILVQKKDIILSSDYTLLISDDAPDRIKVEVDVTSMPTNLHELSDIFAEDLLRMKIDISNFQLGSISFIGDMMQNETYHAVDNNGLSPFNNVIVPSPLFSVSNVNNHQLTLTFDNEVFDIDAQGNQFYEFDIVVEADDAAFFNGGTVFVQYNPLTFGNNVNVLLAPNPNQTTTPINTWVNYAFNPSRPNNTNDILRIDIVPLFPQNLDFLQPNDPTAIVKVRLPIVDCSQQSNLSFPANAAGSNLLVTYFEPGNALLQNFNLIHNDFDNTQLCPNNVIPSIVNISTNTPPNTPIGGGIGTILTIDGQNLGANVGSVLFPNADANDPVNNALSPVSYIKANTVDDVAAMTWNANQVTIPIGHSNTVNQVLGGGRIKLELDNGGTTTRITSPTDLTLDYTTVLHISPFDDHNYRLHHVNVSNGGYTFEIQQNLANLNANTLNLVSEAIHQWQCETNINFQVSPNFLNIPNEIDIDDNHNTIGLGTFPIPDIAAETYLIGIVGCPNNNNEEVWYVDEIDIQINANLPNNLVWFFTPDMNTPVPNGGKDFFAVILHELGHAHLLGHVLKHDNQGITPVMYPFGADHTDRLLQAEDIAGGDKVMDFNANVVFGGGCPLGTLNPFIPNDCVNNTNDLFQDKIDFSVFPNPINNNDINLSYTLSEKSKVSIYITNALGQVVFQQVNITQFPNDYNRKIPTQKLSNGIYFLSLEVNGVTTTQKIIVSHE